MFDASGCRDGDTSPRKMGCTGQERLLHMIIWLVKGR